ncbi:FecR family protein [Tellurirhabdus rosea]|uniref:FecR family protein n=1 Tax=Tellurirhabdus rosea TaxID=2674997 RepID=UPI00224D0A12|nr:FecR domain-containing protein [Tellurirhabdus rosea]
MTITKELLFSYFAGNASALQKRQIDEWVREPVHEELFYQWLDEWEKSQPQYAVDVPAAIGRYHDYLRHRQTATGLADEPPVRVRTLRRGWLTGVAASVALLLTTGWLYRDQIRYRTYATTFGQTQSHELPDGSRVTLNANSLLRIPRFGFGSGSRDVHLSGEAVFSVRHQPDNQPFRVRTDNRFEVVVLGTEFSVFARRRGARVVLNKGKVQINENSGNRARQVLMKPGDLVTLDHRGRLELRRVARPELLSAWKEHRFVFEQTSLQELTNLFRENYGLRLVFSDQTLARQTISGSFTASNADELLTILGEALDLKFSRRGRTVLVSETSVL